MLSRGDGWGRGVGVGARVAVGSGRRVAVGERRRLAGHTPPGVGENQDTADEQTCEDDQTGLGAERPARQRGRALDRLLDQVEAPNSADREPEDRAFEEVPTEVEADRQPKLASADPSESEEEAGAKDPERRRRGGFGVGEVCQAKDGRGEGEAPAQAHPFGEVLQVVAAEEELLLDGNGDIQQKPSQDGEDHFRRGPALPSPSLETQPAGGELDGEDGAHLDAGDEKTGEEIEGGPPAQVEAEGAEGAVVEEAPGDPGGEEEGRKSGDGGGDQKILRAQEGEIGPS